MQIEGKLHIEKGLEEWENMLGDKPNAIYHCALIFDNYWTFRKLFLEGCAPKPIEENVDNDTEETDEHDTVKPRKKKKKGT